MISLPDWVNFYSKLSFPSSALVMFISTNSLSIWRYFDAHEEKLADTIPEKWKFWILYDILFMSFEIFSKLYIKIGFRFLYQYLFNITREFKICNCLGILSIITM